MDDRLERWINGPAGSQPALDAVMKGLAAGAEVAFLLLVAGWFLWGWYRREARDREGAIAALLAAAGALGVNQVIAAIWARPRPFITHPAAVHVLLGHSNDPSFPSDHAAAAFAIAGVVMLVHRRAGIAALVVAACVAYARVYVGDHYPGDVAAGAAVGLAMALLVTTWLRRVPAMGRQMADRALVLLRIL